MQLMGLKESCKERAYTKRQRKRKQEKVIGKMTQLKASYFVVFRAVKSSAR
jgi:serine kinase of HPr protein (carbohydrate metabolism regulator)